MTLKEAIVAVLEREGKPLHTSEIARIAVEDGLWTTRGKTPARSVSRTVTQDIQTHGERSTLAFAGKGRIGLRVWARQPKPPGEEMVGG